MTSQARIDANIRNAQRSTGPKSPEGRERCRMNALKHGLRSDQVVLPTEDADEFAAYHAAWVADWTPTTQASLLLVDRAVAAAWKLRRADRVETTRISGRIRRTLGEIETEANRAVQSHLRLIPNRPAAAVARLESTREGLAMLVRLWDGVAALASLEGGWADLADGHERMVNLLGYKTDDPMGEKIETLASLSWRLLGSQNPEMAEAESITPLNPHLAATVAAQIAELARSKADGYRAGVADRPDVSALQAEATACEPEPRDVALQRLQGRLEREVRSAIAQLTRLKTIERREAEDRARDEPVAAVETQAPPRVDPESKPEPTPEPQTVRPTGLTVVTNEPSGIIAIAAVPPVTQARRDRDGRVWPVEPADGPPRA